MFPQHSGAADLILGLVIGLSLALAYHGLVRLIH